MSERTTTVCLASSSSPAPPPGQTSKVWSTGETSSTYLLWAFDLRTVYRPKGKQSSHVMNFSDMDNTYAKTAFHSSVLVTFIGAQLCSFCQTFTLLVYVEFATSDLGLNLEIATNSWQTARIWKAIMDTTGFFVRFWKNSVMKKKLKKNRFKKKNSEKFSPKTQPIAGFSLVKIYKKNSLYEKTAIFAPKTQFSPWKSMHCRP